MAGACLHRKFALETVWHCHKCRDVLESKTHSATRVLMGRWEALAGLFGSKFGIYWETVALTGGSVWLRQFMIVSNLLMKSECRLCETKVRMRYLNKVHVHARISDMCKALKATSKLKSLSLPARNHGILNSPCSDSKMRFRPQVWGEKNTPQTVCVCLQKYKTSSLDALAFLDEFRLATHPDWRDLCKTSQFITICSDIQKLSAEEGDLTEFISGCYSQFVRANIRCIATASFN